MTLFVMRFTSHIIQAEDSCTLGSSPQPITVKSYLQIFFSMVGRTVLPFRPRCQEQPISVLLFRASRWFFFFFLNGLGDTIDSFNDVMCSSLGWEAFWPFQ